MKAGIVREADIAPDMLQATFTEGQIGHHTLGEEIGVRSYKVGEQQQLIALPVGTKLFVRNPDPELQSSVHDSVAMILGHNESHAQLLTLSPKGARGWGMHNAYGQMSHEIPDALAALDRLFDPKREFGSIAVLSEATVSFIGGPTSDTIGAAGCGSHESERLSGTLGVSQLLDTYDWKPLQVRMDSSLVRRDESGNIIYLAPGSKHPNQPDFLQRDQRSMLDRIERVTSPGTALAGEGITPIGVLRGIEHAVESGVFVDRQAPIRAVSQLIVNSAKRAQY